VILDEVTWEIMEGDLPKGNLAKTITVLSSSLYDEGLMVPGDLTPRGFDDWPGGRAEWLLRPRRELGRIDWKPMGAGFYLRLTDGGVLDLSKSRVEATGRVTPWHGSATT
jgi:hypothetical protein